MYPCCDNVYLFPRSVSNSLPLPPSHFCVSTCPRMYLQTKYCDVVSLIEKLKSFDAWAVVSCPFPFVWHLELTLAPGHCWKPLSTSIAPYLTQPNSMRTCPHLAWKDQFKHKQILQILQILLLLYTRAKWLKSYIMCLEKPLDCTWVERKKLDRLHHDTGTLPSPPPQPIHNIA